MMNDKRLTTMENYKDVDEYNKTKNLENTELNENQIDIWT